jgi:hypothetical protein
MNQSEISDRIEKLNTYLLRICSPDDIKAENRDLKLSSPDYDKCLSDIELDIIDKTTDSLRKYISKLNILGIGSKIVVRLIKNKTCFIICGQVDNFDNFSSTFDGAVMIIEDTSEYVKSLKYLSGYENIKMPPECKERLITKTNNHHNMLADIVANNIEWKNFGSDILSNLCKGNRFVSLGQSEYDFFMYAYGGNFRVIGNFLSIGLRMYENELLKHPINSESIENLRMDMNSLLINLLKCYVMIENDKLKHNSIISLSEFYARIYDTKYALEMRTMLDLINSNTLEKYIVSNKVKEIFQFIDVNNTVIGTDIKNKYFDLYALGNDLRIKVSKILISLCELISNNEPILENISYKNEAVKYDINDAYKNLLDSIKGVRNTKDSQGFYMWGY